MIRVFALALMLISGAAAAQQTNNGFGAVLRALDKTSGTTIDMVLEDGEMDRIGLLKIVLNECRYPAGNPAGDAYAAMEISETGRAGTVFSGWMIASAPALHALEHPRFDVWVMRCTTS